MRTTPISGICGIVDLSGASTAESAIRPLMCALAGRGRDREATFAAGPVALGHRLLRVNTEDDFDRQPVMQDERRLVAVADLRLDNREELAEELAIPHAALARLADSALILPAYMKWGETFAEHLLGDFAVAIWDARDRKLVLARDHMGQRTVFYFLNKQFFAFASDIKSLWALPNVPRTLDEIELARRLLRDRSRPPGATLFSGIRAVPGGTVLTVSPQGIVKTRRYWEPRPDPSHQGRGEAYYVETYKRVLSEAVACRVRRMANPAGLFLAGGFDSTAIAGLAGPVVAAQGRKLVCASSVMPDGYAGPLRHARPWVELVRKKMAHLDVRYITRENRHVLSGIPRAYLREEMPLGTGYYVTDALLECLADAGVRLVMDGHGGDYTLNPRASDMIAEFFRRGRLLRFAREFKAYAGQPGIGFGFALRKVAADLVPSLMAWQRNLRGHRRPDYRSALFAPGLAAEAGIAAPQSRAGRDYLRGGHRAAIARVLGFVATNDGFGAPALAAHRGMDFTRPFHDKRVVELALSIPDDLYFKNGRERHLAKLALADLYPREFQARETHNDDNTPDFVEMVRGIQPKLLAEIDRMEQSGSLGNIFNFSAMRRNLSGKLPVEKEPAKARGVVLSVQMLLWASYIEWFRRDND